MAFNDITIAQGRGNFLTWCVSGSLPGNALCKPLYIGQAIEPKPADLVLGQVYEVYSADQAFAIFGTGSPLALMAVQHFDCCPSLPLSLVAVGTTGTAVVAENTMTITGPATAAGILSFAVMDVAFQIVVQAGDTAADIATATAAAISARTVLPFTAEADAAVVTLTAKFAGDSGNWFAPLFNPNMGDALPGGVTVEIEQSVTGAADIDIDQAASLFACCYDCVATSFEDEDANNQILDWIADKWDCGIQGNFCGGHLFHAKTDTVANLVSYGKTRNSAAECVIPVPLRTTPQAANESYKYPGYLLAAAMASRVCCTACEDPSRPVQYDNGVLCELYDSRLCAGIFSQEEKRALFDAGLVLWDVAGTTGVRDTSLVIEEPLTTYKYSPTTGAPDLAWRRVETRYTTMKFTRDLGTWYKANYSSVSLVNDGTRIPRGKRAISPSILRASITAWILQSQVGLTAEGDAAAIEKMVTVTRTNQPGRCDPDRVDVSIDLDLVNQLARIATSVNVSPEFSCRVAA